MRLVKLAGINVDVTVGAMESNYRLLLREALNAADRQATVAASSEMVLCGYPAEDLVHWHGFVDQQWQYLNRFATDTAEFHTVFVVGLAVYYAGAVYNCAAVVHHGEILGIVPKEKLPTYNVFYDMRTFARGVPGMLAQVNGIPFGDLVFQFEFGKLAVEVCEDVWTPDGPMKRRAYAGAEIVVNISASPWRAGVIATRREMLATRSSDNYATTLYVNGVGGMDALVFDGGGFVYQNGRLAMEAKRWVRYMTWECVVDLEHTRLARSVNTTHRLDAEAYRASGQPMPHVINCGGKTTLNDVSLRYPIPHSKTFLMPSSMAGKSPCEEYFEELVDAMVLGFTGYFEKSKAFETVLIALSGGRDSALTLLLVYLYAKRRFNNGWNEIDRQDIFKFIRCVSMPTRFNSSITKSIAHDLCAELGVGFEERPIQEAFERELVELREQLSGVEPDAISMQNIMPRIRMTRMQNLANASKAMLIHCGNMTEKALGYGTIGGDFTAGAYSLLGNLPKTVIRELISYLQHTHFHLASLDALIASEESAELADGQKDEDDIGSIVVLDACVSLFYGEKLMPSEVYTVVRDMWTDDELGALYPGYQAGMLKKWVKGFVRMTYRSTFKWVVAPPAVHLGSLDLDRERALQIPIVKSEEWLRDSLEKIDSLPD